MPNRKIFLWLLWSVCYMPLSWAQMDNLHIYQSWWEAFPDTVQAVEGFALEEWTLPISIDSQATQTLWVNPPTIVYLEVGKKMYERSMQQPYERVSGGERISFRHTYVDTLSQKEMRSVIRRSPEPLAGEDPTFGGQWGRPVAWVVSGTGIIFGLFYIRSQSR
ncbi:MAG: hypothetical protein AAFQ83_12515 [Bacteroidota bacterium]